jgi:glycerol uptake facilitator-like aquaporin
MDAPARQHRRSTVRVYPNIEPFAGRLGGNQTAGLDGQLEEPEPNKTIPDATPWISLSQQLGLRAFASPGLWKAALIEGWGTLMFVYMTIWANMSPNVPPQPPDAQLGNFNNAAFVGPAVGGLINFVLLTLFIICFGAVTGAHFNPTITAATFVARLCSLPRAILYIAAQTAGGALAGLLARASYGTADFKVGGCWVFPELVPPADTFVVEFMATSLLLFIAFGAGIDPRQRETVGPALSPFLVGLGLGIISFGTAFARYGYGGASMNPARCLGAFVGSQFPSWHWVHWLVNKLVEHFNHICINPMDGMDWLTIELTGLHPLLRA